MHRLRRFFIFFANEQNRGMVPCNIANNFYDTIIDQYLGMAVDFLWTKKVQ